jgi:capsular exopolysaccharide synthesis family protein
MKDRPSGSTAAATSRVLFEDEGVVAPSKRVAVIESLEDAQSPVGEEFRLLRAKVQTMQRQRGIRCLGLVSALPREGKSTVSVGLASALAREPGKKVLLVEGDLRRPSISAHLGLAPHAGLAEWLSGHLERVPLRRIEPGGFLLLGAGETPLERPEDLGSPRMDSLLRTARERFDMVVLDATPILPVADVILLQDLVDGFLLVVRSRMTPKEAIRDALGRIRGDRVLGVILNDHREYRESYMAYAYHNYGMSDGSRSGARRSSRRSSQADK